MSAPPRHPHDPPPRCRVSWAQTGNDYTVFLDGRLLATGTMAHAHDRLLADLTQQASHSPTGTLLALVTHTTGPPRDFLIDADGHVRHLDEPQIPAASPQVPEAQAADPPPLPGAAPTGEPLRRSEARARREVLARATRPPARQLMRARRGVAATLAVLVLLALVLLGSTLFRATPSHGVEVTMGETLPTTPPQEWQATSRWRTPPLLPDHNPALVVDSLRVVIVTADRQVAMIEARSGQVLWAAPYPDGQPLTNLALTTIDDQQVIAAHVGTRLAWWNATTGETDGTDLPAQAMTNFRGSAPVITLPQRNEAALIRRGRLTTTPIPPGATVLTGRADGTITAAGPDGWWHLKPGQQPAEATPWEIPGSGFTRPTVVSAMGNSIITLLIHETDHTAAVAVFTDRPSDVRFTFIGTGLFTVGEQARWFPSPSGRWGILNRTLVDTTLGRTIDLGDWTTQLISADRALGQIAGQHVIAGPQIPLGAIHPDEAFPEDLTRYGALVRASKNDQQHLYHLPPKAGS